MIKCRRCTSFITESCLLAVRTIQFASDFQIRLCTINSLVGCQVLARWPSVVIRIHQQRSSRRDVHILHASGDGTTNAEILMVEEVPDDTANGAIHCGVSSRISTSHLESLPISDDDGVDAWRARYFVLFAVQTLLQQSIR